MERVEGERACSGRDRVPRERARGRREDSRAARFYRMKKEQSKYVCVCVCV